MYYTIIHSPYGDIALSANAHGLTAYSFQQGAAPLIINESFESKPIFFNEVITQLEQYFSGARKIFELILDPHGTVFQKEVWQALATINFGDTESYLWLAKKINNAKAVRAVGMANGANPIALIVPCHRVIGSNGKLTGYAGGLALKAKLLMHEGAHFKP